jgi:hypothetical protein
MENKIVMEIISNTPTAFWAKWDARCDDRYILADPVGGARQRRASARGTQPAGSRAGQPPDEMTGER